MVVPDWLCGTNSAFSGGEMKDLIMIWLHSNAIPDVAHG
jgi:hypothetical protein